MLPALSQATSDGRLNVEPGVPDPGAAAGAPPPGPPPRPAPPPAPPRPPPSPRGAAGRTLIASGLRPSTSATLPSGANFTTWLAAASTVHTLSCGSILRPYATLKP